MKRWMLTAFLGSTLLCFSNITTIDTFQEAAIELEKTDSTSLVIFDVDEVLIVPEDKVVRLSALGQKPDFAKDFVVEDNMELLSVVITGTRFMLVDRTLPSMIEALQKRGIKTIALTSARTGRFGKIASMEDWRIGQLADLEIDFSSSFPEMLLPFPELLAEPGNIPLFKKGILFLGDFYSSEKSVKGELLEAFLDKINWTPKKVIFFDNEWKNLSSVQQVLEKRNIPFEGFHYKGALALAESIEEDVVYFQFSHLLKNKEWLTDKQAKQLMQNEK